MKNDTVETIASFLPIKKNARKKSGTLISMSVYPELNPVAYSINTAMPFVPPGAKLFGLTNMYMPSARRIPDTNTGQIAVFQSAHNCFLRLHFGLGTCASVSVCGCSVSAAERSSVSICSVSSFIANSFFLPSVEPAYILS